jgi:hypothetical protein
MPEHGVDLVIRSTRSLFSTLITPKTSRAIGQWNVLCAAAGATIAVVRIGVIRGYPQGET